MIKVKINHTVIGRLDAGATFIYAGDLYMVPWQRTSFKLENDKMYVVNLSRKEISVLPRERTIDRLVDVEMEVLGDAR